MSHLKEKGCFFPYDVNAAQAKVISVLANSRSVKSKPCSTFGKCLRVPILTKYSVEKEKVFALPTVTNQVFGKKMFVFICSADASLYWQRLCYSFSAVAIGKLLNVNIIYIAIACTVVLLFECCECWLL